MGAAASPIFRDLAFIFIAAVSGGLLARWLRQPLIVGYVLGGIFISPFTPGPSVSDIHSLELFAEIGVILLMFSIGLEFSLPDLMRVKWVALAGGPLGILASMALGMALAGPMGWSATQGIVIGTVVSVASTMVLARFLIERGELRTERGRVMIGVTLVEDLAVVILTVLLPSFASLEASRLATVGMAIGKALLLLTPVVLAAAWVVPRLLSRVAHVHSQELFLIVILALCMGTAALTQSVGLSLALGAFLAGLLISGSEYAREALGHLLPLRDAFVALFFVTVGLLIDPRSLVSNVPLLLTIVGMIIVGKFFIWTAVVRLFRYSLSTALLTGLGLTQIGEFSFILVQVARDAKLVEQDVYNATLAASLVSILINAALMRYGSAWIAARLQGHGQPRFDLDPHELRDHVVLCGFGRIGGPAGTAFETFKVPYVVIERDPDVVKRARAKRIPCIFGDPSHTAVLEAAHAERARLVVVTLPEFERAYLAVKAVRAVNQTVPILARAHRRPDHEALLSAGASRVVQPEVEASATLISSALDFLRVPPERSSVYLEQYREAMRLAQSAPRLERSAMPELRDIAVQRIKLTGVKLRDSRIREKFGLTVVAVRRGNGEVLFNPPSDTELQHDDVLQVLCLPEQAQALEAELAKV